MDVTISKIAPLLIDIGIVLSVLFCSLTLQQYAIKQYFTANLSKVMFFFHYLPLYVIAAIRFRATLVSF